MDIDRYQNIEHSTDFKLYSFISTGTKGNLVKLVKFSAFGVVADTHNLALATIRNDEPDYLETTDNNDRDKILSTIFHIARTFSDNYPEQKIFIRGRNEVTTRLYRGAINHEYAEIILDFLIYGGSYIETDNQYSFEKFIQNKKYDCFLFERR